MPIIESNVDINSEEYILNYNHHQRLSHNVSELTGSRKKMGCQ